jgi:hypothetical protein
MKDKFACYVLASVHLKHKTLLLLIVTKDDENVKINSVYLNSILIL